MASLLSLAVSSSTEAREYNLSASGRSFEGSPILVMRSEQAIFNVPPALAPVAGAGAAVEAAGGAAVVFGAAEVGAVEAGAVFAAVVGGAVVAAGAVVVAAGVAWEQALSNRTKISAIIGSTKCHFFILNTSLFL